MKFLKRLQRAIRRVSPFRAQGWDGASHGRRLINWHTESTSINSLLHGNLETLRARSRHLSRNNPYALHAIEALVANTIGTGIKPQSKAKNHDFRSLVHDLWLQWTDEADYEERLDFYGLQALVTRAMVEGGECLVRLHVNLHAQTIPLQLQVLEAEHLDITKDGRLPNGFVIKGGIEFNKHGKRVAYHIKREHPGEKSFLDESSTIRVKADSILHIYRPLRPGQIRGIPWLSSVLLKLYELDQYDDAEIVRKKTAAMYTGFITKLDPEAPFMGESQPDDAGISHAGLQPGTLQMLEPGEDIKFSDPADVGGSYEAFMRQQLRSIAIGMGLTYEQLTGDLTGVNYSSIRAGLIEFRRKCSSLQHHTIVHQLCRPVFQKWLQLALIQGTLRIPREDNAWNSVKWIPQGWDWVDPLKDQQAQTMAVKNGFKSRAQVVSELGYNVEEIDYEIASDHLRAEALDLHYDTHTRPPTSRNSN